MRNSNFEKSIIKINEISLGKCDVPFPDFKFYVTIKSVTLNYSFLPFVCFLASTLRLPKVQPVQVYQDVVEASISFEVVKFHNGIYKTRN